MPKKTSRSPKKSRDNAAETPPTTEAQKPAVAGTPTRDWWESVEYGDFDLSDFRWHAAALAKYLIRCREKSDPGFLGAPERYQRWELANIARDRESQLVLLKKAVVAARLILADMEAMGGSGGVQADDPLIDLKFMIANFADEAVIEKAIVAVRRGNHVQWKSLAHWQGLSAIRDGLDSLPTKRHDPDRPPLAFKQAPIAKSARVLLFPRGHNPAAIIVKTFIRTLTAAQFDVLKALIEASPAGLSKHQLIARSHHGDAIGVLRRLARAHGPWRHVIDLPGVPGGGYRIN